MRMIELRRDWRMNKGLYLLIIPVVVYLIIFNYVPMAGIVLGFERFTPKNGVYMSEWVGLKHFTTFFSSVFFVRVLEEHPDPEPLQRDLRIPCTDHLRSSAQRAG